MKVIGLTGGIGMGKSTCAAAFKRARIPVFDADACVHMLQSPGGRALKPIEATFPGTVVNGALDRTALRAAVLGNRDALTKLEKILHPMVRDEERGFLARARRAGKPAAVLDIPLLFETGGRKLSFSIAVSAPQAVQVHRVRLRGKMTAKDIENVIARQMPDLEKRRRADIVIRTGLSRHETQRQLKRIILGLRA
ncbi:MAG: dephospho-CoA kinase [Rhodospirillales bacterium]